jgi:hypothetical protein
VARPIKRLAWRRPGLPDRSQPTISRRMQEPGFLLFASDATLLGLGGAGLLGVAALAILGERRRMRRRHIDAVGWMPWSTVSVLATFGGISLLAVAAKGWLAG